MRLCIHVYDKLCGIRIVCWKVCLCVYHASVGLLKLIGKEGWRDGGMRKKEWTLGLSDRTVEALTNLSSCACIYA